MSCCIPKLDYTFYPSNPQPEWWLAAAMQSMQQSSYPMQPKELLDPNWSLATWRINGKLDETFLSRHVFVSSLAPRSEKCYFRVDHKDGHATSHPKPFEETARALNDYLNNTERPIRFMGIHGV